MATARPLAYASAHRRRFVAELKQFIRFPSISAEPRCAAAVASCARWLARHLSAIGLDGARVIATPRHPLVYAEWMRAAGRPTVLIYGHYDVQPVDPLSAWRSPPFAPTLRGRDLFGRGASDDKGQLFTHVKAIESYLRGGRTLPVNVKCLFEGEEEIGSPHLSSFIARNRRALAADVAVMSDMTLLAPDRPALTYGTRGALYLELEIRGPRQDLHSGMFGGVVHNPLQALSEIIATLHDGAGRIAIPGIYDGVRRWSRAERARMARFGASDDEILADARTARGWGERGYSLYERRAIRPALTINGINGGYSGAGSKGVIPARAVAKLSFRLVPDQDPAEIEQHFREHIARVTPPTVHARVRSLSGAKPALVDPTHPAMRAAISAYEKSFGRPPALVRSGGTIPVANTLQAILRIPTVLMGFGLPDDKQHAPNERFHLPLFFKGITTSIHFLAEVASALEACEGNRTVIARRVAR